jgi:hypothetical protein
MSPKKKRLKSVSYRLPEKTEESSTITFRVPSSLKERLEMFAEENDYKASSLLKSILEQFLDAQKT